MTAQAQREEAEAVSAETPEPAPTLAEVRRRAKDSVPTALPPVQPNVTDGDETSWPELVRAWFLGRVKTLRERELDLIHGPPATIGAMHARHQQAAAHWKSPAVRALRTSWGWLHTAVYAQLLTLADATFSPAGALLAVLFILAAWYWL